MERDQKIIDVKAQINAVTSEFDSEYIALAARAEKLSDEQEVLKKEYEALDAKTGLNALFVKLSKLSES